MTTIPSTTNYNYIFHYLNKYIYIYMKIKKIVYITATKDFLAVIFNKKN